MEIKETQADPEWQWCLVGNFRIQKVYKPKVLERIKNSKWKWWGNSDKARDELIKILEWLDPEESERAKEKPDTQ